MFSAFGNRIDTARSGTFAQAERGLSAGEAANRRAWFEGLGAWGEQDPRANASGYKIGAGGFAFGFETDRSAREVMGVSAGYTRSKVEGTDSANGDDVRVAGYHLGGYLSRTDQDMTLDASVVLGYNDYESQRNIVFPGFAETVRGDYQGWGIGARAEFGLPFGLSAGWSGRWLAGARAGYLSTQGYSEEGSAAVVQHIDSNQATSLQSVLGIELTQKLSNQSQLQLHARYLHEFADAPDIQASFIAGGPSFITESVTPNRDSLQLGVSYSVVSQQGVTVSIGYAAEIKEKYLAHQLAARAVWNF
jgi:outer membrane autotransporter protein